MVQGGHLQIALTIYYEYQMHPATLWDHLHLSKVLHLVDHHMVGLCKQHRALGWVGRLLQDTVKL